MHRETGFALLAVAGALFSAGCTQNAQPVTLRSLEASGRFSFLCLGTKDPTVVDARYAPRDMDDCPDQSLVDGESRSAFALVTQVTRGEVAVVDMTRAVATGLPSVVDTEPSIPGFNFLPVGAQPTGIVSTPGAVASFVGVGEVGKEGIFGLPTSCVLRRDVDAPVRDLTTWPACRLPSAPGELAIIIDRPPDPERPELFRQKCGDPPTEATPQPSRACPADLATETSHPGRRKLVVSLPDRSEIVVIDAQELLDRDPGTYEPCVFEQQVRLETYLPHEEFAQVRPPDLPASEGSPPGLVHTAPETPLPPRPAGFALVDDPTTQEHRLFVADTAVPVIHELDTTDACVLAEKRTPLLPVSFADPNRVVSTTKIAASPLTVPEPDEASNQVTRYLYAVDYVNGGSVMFFDISPGSTDRTPLLRTHGKLMPFEPPDRIAFDSPARDVTFALRDHVKADPANGSQKIGQLCNPDPNIPVTDPGALARPTQDLSTGAAPGLLRGLFGFVALESGHIAVIDVQDFDKPCRRPVSQNLDKDTENFRGCQGDAQLDNGVTTYQTPVGCKGTACSPTVTDEVTCQTVQSNRVRSAAAMRNNISSGNHAPSLRSFPTLVSNTGRSLATNRTNDGLANPRMLGVDFSATDKAEVWVGTTLFSRDDPNSLLVIDPAQADQSSLVMSFREPRVFSPQQDFSAVFEGVTVDPRISGLIDLDANKVLSLNDSGASFCDRGVQDVNLAKVFGSDDFHVAGAALEAFGSGHADHVELLSDLLPDTDMYWKSGNTGATCGGADRNQPGAGYQICFNTYGVAAQQKELPDPDREFRIVHAEAQKLVIEAPDGSPAHKDSVAALFKCCFPTAITYDVRASREWVVRASGSPYRHNIANGPDGHSCVVSTDPLKSRLKSRAIEVSCQGTDGVSDCAKDASGNATIGLATSDDVACVSSAANPFVPQLVDPDATGCIYNGLSASFVIYRGAQQTRRNFQFSWGVVGGFSPQLLDLSSSSDGNTAPISMAFSPGVDGLVLADGSSKGLVIVHLSTFSVTLNY
jgi:hypothetical protein